MGLLSKIRQFNRRDIRHLTSLLGLLLLTWVGLDTRFIVQVLQLAISLLLTFDLVEDWFNLYRGTLLMMDGLVLCLRNIPTALTIRFLRHIV